MVGILKFIKGYLYIRIWGFSPERFMNLCSNREILLWDIARENDQYVMYISLKSFYKLKAIAKKTGVRVVILKRYGLPFLIPKLWKRKIFILGLLAAVFFWFGSTFYIWNIDLEGNFQITQDMFDDFLAEKSVKVGMRKVELDIPMLEKEIRREFPQVTWTSAKLTGTKLKISIKENDAPIISDNQKQDVFSDLVSQYDGTIVSMIVRSGVPKVAIGDVITKDTVLVEGKVPILNEDATIKQYHNVAADADICLEHITSYHESLEFDGVKKVYTGRTKTHPFLRVHKKTLAIPEKSPFLQYDTLVKENSTLAFEKLEIPISWGSEIYREYINVEFEYTLEQAKTILYEKFNTFLTTLEEKGVQIIEKDVKIDTNDGMWVLDASLLVQEMIGKSIPFVPDDSMNSDRSETMNGKHFD